MLDIRLPDNCRAERLYVLDVVLGEFLGLRFTTRWDGVAGEVQIRDGQAGPVLRLADTFFDWAATHWLRPAAEAPFPLAGPVDALPRAALAPFDDALPMLFGAPDAHGAWSATTADGGTLGLDVFGAAFFMLSRYEEIVVAQRDEFDRFPASASVAGRSGVLDRPIVDEYVEVLWHALARLWPGLDRRVRSFRTRLTHDVDLPLKHGFSPWYRTGAAALRDAVKEGPRAAVERLRTWRAVRGGQPELDPYNTFGWLMSLAERHGLHGAYYFLAGRLHKHDGLYDVEHPFIARLMHDLHARGHEIGLHPSFTTCGDEAQTAREFERLRAAARAAGVQQAAWGGRQHFLRWNNPQTLRNWERAGLAYDSTLGYADRNGFRCGVCREYPAYDLLERRRMALRLRPLIMMEATFATYMRLGWGQPARDHVARLKDACRRVDGEFVLLWHNSNLTTNEQRDTLRIAVEN